MTLDSARFKRTIVECIMLTDQARTAFLVLSLAQISSQQQQLSHQIAILRRLRSELDIEVLAEELDFEMPRKRRPVHDRILTLIDEAGAVSAAKGIQGSFRGRRVVK